MQCFRDRVEVIAVTQGQKVSQFLSLKTSNLSDEILSQRYISLFSKGSNDYKLNIFFSFLFSGFYLFLQVHFTSLHSQNVKLRHYLCIGWGELNFSFFFSTFFQSNSKRRSFVKKHSTIEYQGPINSAKKDRVTCSPVHSVSMARFCFSHKSRISNINHSM